MGQVLLWPFHTDPEGLGRLSESLVKMVEDGYDLGSRDVQIRALGSSLSELLKDLRVQLETLGLTHALDVELSAFNRLAELAVAYHAGDTADPL